MPGYVIYVTATGRPISMGTTPAVSLPAECTQLDLESLPDMGGQMWDAATTTFVPRPAEVLVDRLQDLVERPEFDEVWVTLNATQRQKIRNAVIWLIGRHRYRNTNGQKEIE